MLEPTDVGRFWPPEGAIGQKIVDPRFLSFAQKIPETKGSIGFEKYRPKRRTENLYAAMCSSCAAIGLDKMRDMRYDMMGRYI